MVFIATVIDLDFDFHYPGANIIHMSTCDSRKEAENNICTAYYKATLDQIRGSEIEVNDMKQYITRQSDDYKYKVKGKYRYDIDVCMRLYNMYHHTDEDTYKLQYDIREITI